MFTSLFAQTKKVQRWREEPEERDNDLVISALLDGITNNGFRESETHLRLRDSEVGPADYLFWIFVLESEGMNGHNHFPASTKNTVFRCVA
jgi:hypothetical protein